MDEIREGLLAAQDEKCPKIRYETRKAARWAVMKHWKSRLKIGSIYHCESCKGFHLTKRKPGNGKFRFL